MNKVWSLINRGKGGEEEGKCNTSYKAELVGHKALVTQQG